MMGLLPTHTQIQPLHIMQQPWAVLIIKWSRWDQLYGMEVTKVSTFNSIKVILVVFLKNFRLSFGVLILLFQLRCLISKQAYGRIKPITLFVKLCWMIIHQSVSAILCWLLVGTVKKLKKLSPKCIRSLRSFEIMYGLKLET